MWIILSPIMIHISWSLLHDWHCMYTSIVVHQPSSPSISLFFLLLPSLSLSFFFLSSLCLFPFSLFPMSFFVSFYWKWSKEELSFPIFPCNEHYACISSPLFVSSSSVCTAGVCFDIKVLYALLRNNQEKRSRCELTLLFNTVKRTHEVKYKCEPGMKELMNINYSQKWWTMCCALCRYSSTVSTPSWNWSCSRSMHSSS